MSATTTRDTPGRAAPATTLRDEFGSFTRSTNARVEAAAVVGAVLVRLLAGPFDGGDAVIVAALLAVQPFFEWTFHVYVLHYRPLQVFGRVVDFELARKHREHHADPSDVALVLVPLRSLAFLTAGAVLGCLVLFPTRAAAFTALAGAAALLLAYEWTHYLIHSRYRPRTRIFRAVWRAHRLHHFKNEQYWFGVTSPAADYVLQTFPAASTVATSPTARDLNAR
jgi:sterol desaturase/sphingolipid hydroxylase (fatty acid hydroxylase superfamily)